MRCIYISEGDRNIRVAAKFLHAARLSKTNVFSKLFFKSKRENDLSKWKNHFRFFIETFLWLLRVIKVVTIAIEWVSRERVSNNRIYFGANQHTKTTKVRTLRTVPCFADSSTHRKSNRALTYRKWRVESNMWKWVAWYTGCRIVR